MIPGEFDYFAPRSLEEALTRLSEDAGAKLLGGGMSLLPALKHRMFQPSALIDLARIPGLDSVAVRDGAVVIGGRATHSAVLASEAGRGLPILQDAAAVIGDVQVRNRGTFGGSLVHADPAGDWPAVFLALGGEADLVGPEGRRSVPARSFFTGMLTSAVRRDEILTQVKLPLASGRAGSAYAKLRHPASGFALVGVAASVTLDPVQRITHAAIAVTGVNAVPFLAQSVAERLKGQTPDTMTFRSCCGSVGEADPMDDLNASADYRLQLLSVLTVRALRRACERAQA